MGHWCHGYVQLEYSMDERGAVSFSIHLSNVSRYSFPAIQPTIVMPNSVQGPQETPPNYGQRT